MTRQGRLLAAGWLLGLAVVLVWLWQFDGIARIREMLAAVLHVVHGLFGLG